MLGIIGFEDGKKVGFQNMKSNYQLQQGLNLGKCLIKLSEKYFRKYLQYFYIQLIYKNV